MRRLWGALYVITALGHLIFAVGLGFVLHRLGVPLHLAVAALTAAALVVPLRGRIRRGIRDLPIPAWRLALVEEPYYVHWCATVATIPLFVLGSLVVTIGRLTGLTASLPAALAIAALSSYVAAFALSFYGVVVRRRWVRVRTLDVSVTGLGAAFDGYRIAQLSDLHIGGLCPRRRADRWIRKVNDLDVDLIAFTGDYVTNGTAFHEDIAAVLSAMQSRDGAIAVMGNHDYFGDGEPLITLLRERGVRVLRNEHATLARAGARITIAGVDDTWTRRADVHRALEGRAPDQPLIALAHDPQLFPELARHGAALVLSGHTHWGQLALPFLPTVVNLSRFSYRYHAGIYRIDDATLYVHPGLGTTGPPVRIGAPPEITVLRLRCQGAP